MSTWDNPAVLADLVALRERGYEWADVAIRLNQKYQSDYTGDACSGKHRRLKLAGELGKLAVDLAGTDEPRYDDLVVQWNEWLGRTVKERQATPTTVDDDGRPH